MLGKKEMKEEAPVFNHDLESVIEAVGVPNIASNIQGKIEQFNADQGINSPSKVVEAFYNRFSKIELAFLCMHAVGREKE